MAPSKITEDYYMVLEVGQTATLELISRSYRRLALKLHPDRNAKANATEAFQLLGRAYETLRDEGQRRAYDLIYPAIQKNTSQYAQGPRPSPSKSEAPSDAAQIVTLRRLKQERGTRWQAKKSIFDSKISELQRDIHSFEREIKNLNSILAAEAAAEAQRNSWATWLLSPLYKQVEDTEDVKARKDRERQERRIQKDMKERRLESKKVDLRKEEDALRKAWELVRNANVDDDQKIGVIEARIWAKANQERLEREKIERERRERVEKERMEEIRKRWREQQEQMEKAERERLARIREQQAEKLAAERKRREEEERRRERLMKNERLPCGCPPLCGHHYACNQRSNSQAERSSCLHDEWWPTVQGRTACPECYDIWTYLLQCPGCEMKACPKCQASIRPRLPRNTARARARVRSSPRVRASSPMFYAYDYD